MKINQFVVPLFLIVLVSVFSSCLTTTDPAETYAEWKAKNDTYFNSMKDSAGFVLCNVPTNRGGGSFYYKILKTGTGTTSPQYNDSVFVHYQGRLIDWTLFDKTYSGAEPDFYKNENSRTFKVNAVVKGWTEALMQMKVGEKRRIVLPYTLGYGTSGSGSINPYSTLIFDVQLISFGTPLSN